MQQISEPAKRRVGDASFAPRPLFVTKALKSLVFSACCSAEKKVYREINGLQNCLIFEHINEAARKQRKFPVHPKLSSDLSTECVDEFPLEAVAI
ncbi:hypothetical protein K1T73_15805 [Roseovarius sp. SCSIO 43702]|uniref:hypothetical protein n=1 Tax=Roseovarius sp. SCSIO 43702 TaxID=2823043 RepID=UPI001C738039|nr:hypothetical protein [Roseovarius sp. SCSIO 43702]QYX56492.1 hypothetical protein K1T73_15805 [Roseovarius sp. SCSIO 43702]